MSSSDTLSAALDYHARGFSIFPLPHRKKQGKVRWKPYQTQQPTEQQVRKWFSGAPKNIAIVTGDVSNLVVRDFDDKPKYREWAKRHPDLATRVPTVATADGFHVYVSMDPIPRLKVSGVGSGELRGTGGYVVAPPSIHPSGTQYSWTDSLCNPLPIVTFADLDLEHLQSDFTEEDRRGQKYTEEDRLQKPYVEVRERVHSTPNADLLLRAIDSSLPSEVGQRERKIFELARRLKSFGPLSDDQLYDLFDQWWGKAQSIVGTKSYEVSMNAFLRGMENATTPLDDILGKCLEAAKSKPAPEWSTRFNAECQLLAGLCRELQLLAGKEPFFLSCRAAAATVNVSHTLANQFLQLFVRMRKLQVVEQGSAGGHRATRYRYL